VFLVIFEGGKMKINSTSHQMISYEDLKQKWNQKDKTNSLDLSEEEKKQVNDLEKRDQEVKTHEQAHIAAGGTYVQGGADYETTKGPDNKDYAISGEVQIDTSPISGDPEATIDKMRTVRAAALAPAQPSATDQAVAAEAAQQEESAKKEKQEKEISPEQINENSALLSPAIMQQNPEFYDQNGKPVFQNQNQVDEMIE